jgi:hypothetical protein
VTQLPPAPAQPYGPHRVGEAQRGTDVSGPYDEEAPDDAPRPAQPSQQPPQQPPQQPWPQPSQRKQPSQPFAAPPAQQYPQPAPWPLVEPPALRYAHRSFRSVNGLGTAVSILICLVVLAQAVHAASYWYAYKVVKDYVEVRSRISTAWIVPISFGSWPSAASGSRCWPRASCSLFGSGGPGVTLNSSAMESTGAIAAG